MVKMIAARAQRGRSFSRPTTVNRATSTLKANTSCASWLRPPARSAMAVWVGLPLTTKAPPSAAAALAAARPRMSAFSSTRSP